MVTRETLPDLKREWDEYARKVQNIADIYQADIIPKAVYDCFEADNLHYICTASDLLPEELRGSPDDVEHTVIHDLVHNSLDNDPSITRTAEFKQQLTKVVINLEGRAGAKSIHQAWMRLIKLQKTFKHRAEEKVIVKILLQNLEPESTRKVIRSMHEFGSESQKATKYKLQGFHDLMLKIAKANSDAIDYGLKASTARCLVAGATPRAGKGKNTNRQPKRTRTKKPRERTESAIKNGGCIHHGPLAWHGTDECYIANRHLAPPGYDFDRAVENARKSKKRQLKAIAEGKVAGANSAVAEEIEKPSDVGHANASPAYAFIQEGRAYRAMPEATTNPYDFTQDQDGNDGDDESLLEESSGEEFDSTGSGDGKDPVESTTSDENENNNDCCGCDTNVFFQTTPLEDANPDEHGNELEHARVGAAAPSKEYDDFGWGPPGPSSDSESWSSTSWFGADTAANSDDALGNEGAAGPVAGPEDGYRDVLVPNSAGPACARAKSDTTSESNGSNCKEQSVQAEFTSGTESVRGERKSDSKKGRAASTQIPRAVPTPGIDERGCLLRGRLERIASHTKEHDQFVTERIGNQLIVAGTRPIDHCRPFAVVQASPLNGLGLFSAKPLSAGTYLGKYTGRMVAELGRDEEAAAVQADEVARLLKKWSS